jgi:hypothetical protein
MINNKFIKECERYCDIISKYDPVWNSITDFCMNEDSNIVECYGYDHAQYINLNFDARFLLLSNEELEKRIKDMYTK